MSDGDDVTLWCALNRLATSALADWSEQDLQDLTRLLRRFADNLMRGPGKP
jgi:hypothetical protein